MPSMSIAVLPPNSVPAAPVTMEGVASTTSAAPAINTGCARARGSNARPYFCMCSPAVWGSRVEIAGLPNRN